MEMLEAPVNGPAAWRGDDLADSDEWIEHYTEDELAEFERALAAVADTPVEQISRAGVPLPRFEERLRHVRSTLDDGRGFVLLRGLPVHDRFTEDEAIKLLWTFGLHLGTPVSQNRRGERIGHLQNTDRPDAFGRRYATNEALAFHSDNTDFVGLLCLRPARLGGESLLASTMEAYNIVMREHPEYLPVLYKSFRKDRMGEVAPGEPGWHELPLFCFEGGVLSGTTSTAWYVSAMRFDDVPRLTALEMSCFIFLESLPKRPGMALSMTFEPGDIQWLNNFVVTHTRTAYVDDPDDPRLQRHMVRLWLSQFAQGRPLCEAFARNRLGVRRLDEVVPA